MGVVLRTADWTETREVIAEATTTARPAPGARQGACPKGVTSERGSSWKASNRRARAGQLRIAGSEAALFVPTGFTGRHGTGVQVTLGFGMVP